LLLKFAPLDAMMARAAMAARPDATLEVTPAHHVSVRFIRGKSTFNRVDRKRVIRSR
jgi:hypothetical protein